MDELKSNYESAGNLYLHYALREFIKTDKVAFNYLKNLPEGQTIDTNMMQMLYEQSVDLKPSITMITLVKCIIKEGFIFIKDEYTTKFPPLKYINPKNINPSITEEEYVSLLHYRRIKNKEGPQNPYLLIGQNMILELLNVNLLDMAASIRDLSSDIINKRTVLEKEAERKEKEKDQVDTVLDKFNLSGPKVYDAPKTHSFSFLPRLETQKEANSRLDISEMVSVKTLAEVEAEIAIANAKRLADSTERKDTRIQEVAYSSEQPNEVIESGESINSIYKNTEVSDAAETDSNSTSDSDLDSEADQELGQQFEVDIQDQNQELREDFEDQDFKNHDFKENDNGNENGELGLDQDENGELEYDQDENENGELEYDQDENENGELGSDQSEKENENNNGELEPNQEFEQQIEDTSASQSEFKRKVEIDSTNYQNPVESIIDDTLVEQEPNYHVLDSDLNNESVIEYSQNAQEFITPEDMDIITDNPSQKRALEIDEDQQKQEEKRQKLRIMDEEEMLPTNINEEQSREPIFPIRNILQKFKEIDETEAPAKTSVNDIINKIKKKTHKKLNAVDINVLDTFDNGLHTATTNNSTSNLSMLFE